jgi:Leucine-rich repeat (LRR) protein
LYYPSAILESLDSSYVEIINPEFWFYMMYANTCDTVSWVVVADTGITDSVQVDFIAYPTILNCEDNPEFCFEGDTVSFSIPINVGQLFDCTADDGTDGVELWGECYSIENTDSLNLYDNQLYGEIPPEIGNLTNLEYLDLGSNELTGSIPSEIGTLTNLTYLNLGNNDLSGEIPPEIGNLNNLLILKLNDNGLSGSIPIELWGLTNLEELWLHRNELWGSIPPEIGNLANLYILTLSFNEFTESIPNEIGNLINLTRLTFSNNQHSGAIPPEIGNLTNLNYLHLGNNQLSGSLPPEIGNLINLETFFLYSNQITDTIPSEVGNLINIEILSLNENLFTGSIPSEIGGLTNLARLQLNDNQLSGQIPESICGLTNLEWSANFIDWTIYSYLFGNNLCPPYPDCIEEYVGDQDTSDCEPLGIDDIQIPVQYSLHQNYPNPFNPVTSIQYELPENAFVNIRIYDLKGRLINTLVSKEQTAGYKAIKWAGVDDKGKAVSAGIYLYEIQAGNFRETKKMVLLK